MITTIGFKGLQAMIDSSLCAETFSLSGLRPAVLVTPKTQHRTLEPRKPKMPEASKGCKDRPKTLNPSMRPLQEPLQDPDPKMQMVTRACYRYQCHCCGCDRRDQHHHHLGSVATAPVRVAVIMICGCSSFHYQSYFNLRCISCPSCWLESYPENTC